MRDSKGLLTIRNAVENASTVPITDEQIVAMLAGGDGCVSHLQAIFGDVTLQALSRAGAAHGIALGTILDAYARAKETALAANPELDRNMSAGW